MNKGNLFKQQVLYILLPVFISLVILGIYMYQHEKKLIRASNDMRNDMIVDEITRILEIQDLTIHVIEENLEKRMKNLSIQIIKKYFSKEYSLRSLNIDSIHSQMSMIHGDEDLYIIDKNGIVVASTFKKDINLNLFSFGEDHQKFILQRFEQDEFMAERFTIEANTKKTKKYSYQTLPDDKYILEIGCYSDKVEKILELINSTLYDLSIKNDGIEQVDLFVGADKPFSINKQLAISVSEENNLRRIFNSKKDMSLSTFENNINKHIDYIYLDTKSTGLYKGSVIRIISNKEKDHKLLRAELIQFSIMFILTMFVVLIFIYFGTQKIINPIKKLVEKTTSIIKGNLNTQIKIEGNNELAQLTEQFNIMTDVIKSNYDILEHNIKKRSEEVVLKNKQLEEKNTELEKINKKQNQINKKLSLSETNLRQSIATRDKFFSIISHDLKNSFFSLLSFSEILLNSIKDRDVDTEIIEYSNYIHNSAQKLFVVVDNLLNWANTQRGTIKLRPQKLNINSVIQNVKSFLSISADEKSIKIIDKLDKQYIVFADLNMINTVVRNLLSNAIKFTGNKGIITISAMETNNVIQINITDTGVGIRKEKLETLFDANLQSSENEDVNSGSGIGLIIVKEFIEQNKGTINVTSTVDIGSTFSFSLPKQKNSKPEMVNSAIS